MEYQKYINKYLALKNQTGGKTYDFYFVHGTKNLNNIYSILKDGKIKLGKDVKQDQRMHSGNTPLPYIYANIYFNDIKNLSHYFNYSIILHPKIINDYNIIFNEGWTSFPSNNIILNQKNIKKVKKFVKNPTSLTPLVKEFPGMFHHECLFNKEIILKKYLIGIVYVGITDNEKINLTKKLVKYGYPNVKILGNNEPKALSFFTH